MPSLVGSEMCIRDRRFMCSFILTLCITLPSGLLSGKRLLHSDSFLLHHSLTTVHHSGGGSCSTYLYMLCDHRAFMSPESCSKVLSTAGKTRLVPLRQSRPCRQRAYFLFRPSLRVDTFLQWPALTSFSSTHRFQLGKILSANLYSSISHVVLKTGI